VPYWDFNEPNIPDALSDSFAGAVIASALLELKNYVDNEASKKYFTAAKTIIATLTSKDILPKKEPMADFC
jgi:unsaturated chondroitin disaccharide hydrolase